MVALLRDYLRKDMDVPEDRDRQDRDQEEDHP
jgi:hypothetical protein